MSAEQQQHNRENPPASSLESSSPLASAPAKSAESKQALPDDKDKSSQAEAKAAAQAAIRALCSAAEQGDLATVDDLLKSDVSADGYAGCAGIGDVGVNHYRPLFRAIDSPNAEVFCRLLDAKADIQIKYAEYSLADIIALCCAWSPAEKRRVLELLSQRGLTLDLPPIFQAICSGEDFVAEITAEQLDMRDSHGGSVIHWLAANNHWKSLEKIRAELLATPNRDGLTPLMFAIISGHLEVVWLFKRRGVWIDTRNNSFALCDAALNGRIEIMRFLLENGAEIDARDIDGNTVLHSVAVTGRVGVIRFLVESGAPINIQNKSGDTALRFAAVNGHVEAARFLIEKGARIEERDSDAAALVLVKDLRAEHYQKQCVGILHAIFDPHIPLPPALIQVIIEYFAPYTREENHALAISLQKTKQKFEKFRQSVHSFAEDTIRWGWRTADERRLAKELNQQLKQHPYPLDFLTVRTHARDMLIQHAKELGEGELAGILRGAVGEIAPEEKAAVSKQLSPLALISRSASSAREEKKAIPVSASQPKAGKAEVPMPAPSVREQKEEAPVLAENQVASPEPAVSVALRQVISDSLPPAPPARDSGVIAEHSERESVSLPSIAK